MDSDGQLIPKWRAPGAESEVYDCATAARLAGVSSRAFLKYCRMGLYQPLGDVQRYGYTFDLEAVCRARQAERVRYELSVDLQAAILIVKLRLEVESLREELRFWRR